MSQQKRDKSHMLARKHFTTPMIHTTLKQLLKNNVPQVRLELTASAFHSTVYKYGALTDCATGADNVHDFIFAKCGKIL